MNKSTKLLFERINKLLNRPFSVYLLLFFVSVATICFMGYHFGSFDQAIHIPFLKKFSDSSLYPRDGFFDLRWIHYSFFWFMFIPFYKLNILEISMFVIYFAVIYLTFWGFWQLSKTLFHNNIISLLAVSTFIFPHIGFAGFPLIEFSLLNRTFVLPFLLISLDLYLNNRYYAAMIILGIMYNFHVISVNFVLAMVIVDILFRLKDFGLKKIIIMIALFLMGASPVLIWKFQGEGIDFAIHRQWFNLVNLGMLYHLFNLISFKNPKIIGLTLSGIGSILVFLLTIKNGVYDKKDRMVRHFIITAIGILVFVFFSSNLELYPGTIIIQSQIVRIGVFIILFSYLYAANTIICKFQSKKISPTIFFYLITATLFSISPLILLTALVIYKYLSKSILKTASFINIILFLGMLGLGLYLNIWSPGIYIGPHKNEQTTVELWVKANTPKDALFITPPYTWWFYNSEWRVLSERSNLVSLSDLLEVAFSPTHVSWWLPRFEAIAPGVIERFNGDVFYNINITKNAFYNLCKEDFQKVANRYNASYLIVEKPYHYLFPIIYENKRFIVYKIKN